MRTKIAMFGQITTKEWWKFSSRSGPMVQVPAFPAPAPAPETSIMSSPFRWSTLDLANSSPREPGRPPPGTFRTPGAPGDSLSSVHSKRSTFPRPAAGTMSSSPRPASRPGTRIPPASVPRRPVRGECDNGNRFSSALFFENAGALLPAGAVLILEPLIAVIKRVEGSQGGNLIPSAVGGVPVTYLADNFQLPVLMNDNPEVKALEQGLIHGTCVHSGIDNRSWSNPLSLIGAHFFPECFQFHVTAHLHFPKPNVLNCHCIKQFEYPLSHSEHQP